MAAQREPAGSVKIAVGQTNPQMRDRAHNLAQIERMTREAAGKGARLIVFPECALTGYCYASREEAAEDAESIPGPATEHFARVAADTGAYITFGLVEKDGDQIYNAAAIVGPDGFVGKYRKNHLPYEVLDRFVTRGNLSFPVFETAIGRIGILICYDMRFPEPARILALSGADIILHPTNLPFGGAPQADFMYQARAAENRIWILSADRVGVERGVEFIGRSAIIHPNGTRLAEGSANNEELLIAEIEPAIAREKDLIFTPGIYELHTFSDRRPELYGALTRHAIGVGQQARSPGGSR